MSWPHHCWSSCLHFKETPSCFSFCDWLSIHSKYFDVPLIKLHPTFLSAVLYLFHVSSPSSGFKTFDCVSILHLSSMSNYVSLLKSDIRPGVIAGNPHFLWSTKFTRTKTNPIPFIVEFPLLNLTYISEKSRVKKHVELDEETSMTHHTQHTDPKTRATPKTELPSTFSTMIEFNNILTFTEAQILLSLHPTMKHLHSANPILQISLESKICSCTYCHRILTASC